MTALSSSAELTEMPQGSTLDLLKHVLDVLPNPVYVKDRSHIWVEANKAFCDLLGRPREALVGKSDYDFNPPEQADIFWAMDDEVFRGHGKNINQEETVNAQGETLWVESQKSYFRAEDGSEYLVGVLTDLTDMKAHEAELAEAEQDALAAARAKSEFLANMSHEIRTPMNGVLGMTQILRGTELSAMQSELVETLNRSGNALLSLIDDILDFSKIEAGQLQLSPEPFELRSMVDDVAVLLGTVARDKGLDLLVKFAPGLPTHIVGDAGRLRQIMMNLIGNAVKFTETGYVCVEIEGQIIADTLHLSASVCDTGIGIAADKLVTIFEKFQQADGSTTRLYGGTGLGLAISRDLALLMDGTLTATSVPGEGARFTLDVVLPIAAGQPSPAADNQTDPSLDKMKILAVDDISLNLDIITSQLKKLGLSADISGSAKGAVERLVAAEKAGDPYTLLITDYQMPNLDGLKLTQSLRKHPRFTNLAIIVMSSVNDAAVKAGFKSVGVKNYLVKPISMNDFNRMISDTARRLEGAS